MTDLVFRQPAIRLAEAQLPHAPRVSMYRFDLASTAMDGVLGACHAIEVPFVFDNLDRGGVEVLLGGLDDSARRLAHRTAGAWARVAHTASPAGTSSPEGDGSPAGDGLDWPAYDLDQRPTCLLDREVSVVADPEGEIREMWDELRSAPA
jgi:para-nitrobenzyl esterase